VRRYHHPVPIVGIARTAERRAVSTQVERTERSGWIEFAAIVLFAVGVFRIMTAIGAFSDSRRIIDPRHGLFGDELWGWGVWDLAIAVLAFAVGSSLLRGGRLGRVGGYLWCIVAIVQGFTLIRVAPTYATLSLVVAFLVLYALSRGVGVS
jgi:hypothetical protein